MAGLMLERSCESDLGVVNVSIEGISEITYSFKVSTCFFARRGEL